MRRLRRNLVERETAKQVDPRLANELLFEPASARSAERRHMEFLALIHADENGWESLSDEERQAVYQRYMEFSSATRSSAARSCSRPPPRRRFACATATAS